MVSETGWLGYFFTTKDMKKKSWIERHMQVVHATTIIVMAQSSVVQGKSGTMGL